MKEYRTINKIAGPLVFVEKTEEEALHAAIQHYLAHEGPMKALVEPSTPVRSTARDRKADTGREFVVERRDRKSTR